MTLAKTCHASNMMHDFKNATFWPNATTKAFWIAVLMFQCCVEKKLNFILKVKVAMLDE